MKIKNDDIERTGIVTDILGSARFQVLIDGDSSANDLLGGRRVICEICGKMRQKRIKIVKGDKVRLHVAIVGDLDSMRVTIIFRLD